ncbi:MAG: SDR family oxidoreductase [Pseudomonadota bacterium]
MTFQNLDLSGKTALITGGSTGIGLETARLLKSRGAEVLITGRNSDRLADAAAAVPGLKTRVSDAGSPEDIEALAAWIGAETAGLDILVLNAGVTPFAPLGAWDADKIDDVFGINVRGPWLTVQALTTALNEDASIINIGSIAGDRGSPATGVYGATKAALSLMTKALVPTLSDRRIRVNTVSPGPVETPAWSKTGLPDEVIAQVKTDRAAANPLKRYGRPEEVAETIAFLASPAASYVNGVELFVDGGLMAS